MSASYRSTSDQVLWLTIVPLIAGFCLYCLLRHDVWFLDFLFGVKKGVFDISRCSHPILDFIAYCLPDGLWYLALLNTNQIIYDKSSPQNDKFALSLSILAISMPFILEIGQAAGIIAGTFDHMDIATYLTILLIFMSCVRKKYATDYKQ